MRNRVIKKTEYGVPMARARTAKVFKPSNQVEAKQVLFENGGGHTQCMMKDNPYFQPR